MSITTDFFTIIKAFLVLVVVRYVYNTIYKAYFGPLSKIPGPKLFALSNIFFDIKLFSGVRWKFTQFVLFPKYGSIVRASPEGIFVSDRDDIRKIIVTEDFQKAPRYALIRRDPQHETLFTATTKPFHNERRRLLSPAFAIKYLASLDPLVKVCARDLIIKIDQTIEKEGPNVSGVMINIYEILLNFTLDTIGETAFGGKFGMILTGKHPLPGEVGEGVRRRLLRTISPLLKPFFGDKEFLYKFVDDILKKRRQETNPPRKDILQIVLDMQKESGISDLEIFDQMLEFIIAGSDSTGFCISMAVITLLKHQEKLQKLYDELKTAVPSIGPDNLPDHETLKRLPYLNAVINESLRLYPATFGTGRKIDKDVILKGYLIPRGTYIANNFYAAHRSTEYWGEDANEFVPERWLDSGKIPRDAYFPFSAGSRNCIGQNFALLEFRLIITTLVLRYKMVDIPEQDLDIVQFLLPRLRNRKYNVGFAFRK
ncbi:11361_t:CDS:10 [Ambispora gerdemannii]|uniref:11361_t:CDS:1 n=1 Tax=Ambispora gerdemannii TaxID=144530 RepID=A0A9N9G597_9GLOM|nr:11361_t:CDS:10 [Ambispora gerdemannii]